MCKLNVVVITLFPAMFPGPLACSLAGKALEKGLWSLRTLDIRDFATDKHRTVDDSPYGGGVGMVMKADVLGKALEQAKLMLPDAQLIYPSPRGVVMTQQLVKTILFKTNRKAATDNEQKETNLIILCGRFEGIDQRVIDHYQLLEVSLGDFVLSGGEIAAMALLDAAIRLIPGVIGNDQATNEESFSNDENFAGLLEYPHYTRPPLWKELGVPDILISGDHEKIKNWRLKQAQEITRRLRPDLKGA